MVDRRRILVRHGHVVTMDDTIGDLPKGDLLIEGDRIVTVQERIDATADEVIDASGTIVLPGLVDTHIHLWQTVLRGMASGLWMGEYFQRVPPYRSRFRPEDMYAGGFAGGLELLANGVTTAVDFCDCVGSPRHADAAIEGMAASGVRGLHAYSVRASAPGTFTSPEQRLADAARLCGEIAVRGEARIGLMLAISDVGTVDLETTVREVAHARELGLGITMHANTPGQVSALHQARLLGEDMVLVHCNVISDEELELLADAGATMSVTPGLELAFGSPFTMLGRALRRGVRIAWGCDIPSFTNADLLAQMRLAYHVQGCVDGASERAEGRSGKRRPGIPTLTPRAVLQRGTIDAARAIGLGDRIGSLTPGKQADLVLLRESEFGVSLSEPAATILLQSGVQDIDTVIVGGQLHIRHGRLLHDRRPAELIDAARAHVLSPSAGDKEMP
ncbi:amidohydrolase family protein [Streptomyces sp. Marseille-Q5077]|uniref:amidohydrolase family protein n=1 Tax=Streptomyces sp. Marseille-Q5077 TaxID=3418995 RepID=UPI003D037ACC